MVGNLKAIVLIYVLVTFVSGTAWLVRADQETISQIGFYSLILLFALQFGVLVRDAEKCQTRSEFHTVAANSVIAVAAVGPGIFYLVDSAHYLLWASELVLVLLYVSGLAYIAVAHGAQSRARSVWHVGCTTVMTALIAFYLFLSTPASAELPIFS